MKRCIALLLLTLIPAYLYAQKKSILYKDWTTISKSKEKLVGNAKLKGKSIHAKWRVTYIDELRTTGNEKLKAPDTLCRCYTTVYWQNTYNDTFRIYKDVVNLKDITCYRLVGQRSTKYIDMKSTSGTSWKLPLAIKTVNHETFSPDTALKVLKGRETPAHKGDSIVSLDSTAVNYQSLRDMYGRYLYRNQKANLYLGVNYMPSITYRDVYINTAQFTENKAYNYRRQHESNKYGSAFNVQVGVSLKTSHTIFVEYLRLSQGYTIDSTTVNWHTGLSSVNNIHQRVSFVSSGIGVGYNYSGYNHIVNSTFELGLYYMISTKYKEQNTGVNYQGGDVLKAAGLRAHTFGGKFSLGLSIRPYYRLELKLMPMLYYNFVAANKGTLKTNLYNIGLNTGITWRLF